MLRLVRKNQTNIVSIIFSCLLILPLLLVIILQLWQFYLSQTAERRMETETIQTITVKADDVIWGEEGREVTIKGEYYDLVSWSLENGYYTFTGVYDREETAVSNLLEKQNLSENIIIRMFLIGQCFAAIVYFLTNESFLFRKKKQFGYFLNPYKYLFLRIISPPPRNGHSFSIR